MPCMLMLTGKRDDNDNEKRTFVQHVELVLSAEMLHSRCSAIKKSIRTPSVSV